MTTVCITTKKDNMMSTQDIPINSLIKIDSPFIDVANHLNKDDFSALIEFEHHQTTTILNLTNISPYVLLFFDDDLCFQGASYSIKSGSGVSTLQTAYKHILFIRMPHQLDLKNIINLNK
ncbi:hypothetical protein SAMN04515667_0960 [Formosa sp. Hel1_31_208]|uniref:hypothetical protein n=1 Tax=Formosa sp. Hel1_31_208 TaxID=1798225 RepID=UPI00087DDBB6|nr:hypothetical protein [Formosa sp. Hel1_31_208]SDR90694.1 hypothetical protein SAMN04515667_0960 [Formosa sp. Hel1_31_208]